MAQLAERRTRFAGVVSSILIEGLGVAFLATGLDWFLENLHVARKISLSFTFVHLHAYDSKNQTFYKMDRLNSTVINV